MIIYRFLCQYIEDQTYCTFFLMGMYFFATDFEPCKRSSGYPLTLEKVGSWRKFWWTFQLDWQLRKASPNILEFRKMDGLQRSDIMAITWQSGSFSLADHCQCSILGADGSCMFPHAVRIRRTRNRAMFSASLNSTMTLWQRKPWEVRDKNIRWSKFSWSFFSFEGSFFVGHLRDVCVCVCQILRL